MVRSTMCLSKPDIFPFFFDCVSAFGCVSVGTDQENRSSSGFDILGTVELMLTVFFSYGTRSMEDSSFSDS